MMLKVTSLMALLLLLLLWPGPQSYAQQPQADDWTVQAVPWNISGDSYVTHKESFRPIIKHTELNVLKNDWQEGRRQVETKEIRKLTNLALSAGKVDGIVIAGDMNAVGTPYFVLLLLGPIKVLLAVEIFHLGDEPTRTRDERCRQFPTSILHYQLYGSAGLQIGDAYVFDTGDLDAVKLRALGVVGGTPINFRTTAPRSWAIPCTNRRVGSSIA